LTDDQLQEQAVGDLDDEGAAVATSSVGWITGVAVIAGFIAATVIFKKDIQQFLQDFTARVEEMGTLGYFSYAGLYVLLETVAVPATPLTLTAGYLFGVLPGVCVVSLSSTLAAILAFLTSRYLLRERATELFSSNKQFSAIDRAIAKDGFRFVFLLRLSPLLPFAASNYLYGLTAVPLDQYALASWLGMLPGTWAYISAGNVGRQVVDGAESGLPPWEIGVGLLVTVIVLLLTGNLAREALKEIEEEEA